MDLAILSGDGSQFLFRWIHFLAGVTWIGILYYFNFIQGEWFKEIDGSHKSVAVQKLVPRALWWFRWGAMFTFLSGAAILLHKGGTAGWEIYHTSWGIMILTGAAMGTIMFLNVWVIIWPAQKIVIASTTQVAGGGEAIPEAAAAGPKAALASRTNTLLSIPMLFFMGGASHLPLSVNPEYNCTVLCAVLTVIIGGVAINGVKGKTGPFTSVKGVITCGFILTAIIYGAIEALT
jgi:uncharacterized membrane protein